MKNKSNIITQEFLDSIVTEHCDEYIHTSKKLSIKIKKNKAIIQLKENCSTPMFLNEYGLKKLLKNMTGLDAAVFVDEHGIVYKIIINKADSVL